MPTQKRKAESLKRVVISFGPEHSLLEQRQVELAWEDGLYPPPLKPKPGLNGPPIREGWGTDKTVS